MKLCSISKDGVNRIGKVVGEGVIAGYLMRNDISVRDSQQRSPTFTLGESFDTRRSAAGSPPTTRSPPRTGWRCG